MSDLPSSSETLQSTTNNQKDAEKPKGSKNRFLFWGVGIIVAGFVCLFMLIAGGMAVSYKQKMNATGTVKANNAQSTATKHAQNLNATAVKQEKNAQATATRQEQRVRGTATMQAYYAQATANAQSALDMVPQEVRTGFRTMRVFETFDKAGSWETYTDKNEFYNGGTNISSGSFVLNIDKSYKTFVHRDHVPLISAHDFYFQVEARRLIGSKPNACYGIAFREMSSGFYTFVACDDQKYSVSYLDESKDKWTDIRDWTVSSKIHPEAANRMGVAAKDKQFDFYINGEKIYSFTDERTPGNGNLSLLVNINVANIRPVSFEFDNIIILVP